MDLPAPLGPTMPTRSPALTSKDSAVVGDPAPARVGERHVLEAPRWARGSAASRRRRGSIAHLGLRRRGSARCRRPRRGRACPGGARTRSSRSGRNTSTPSMRTTRSAPSVHLPLAHPLGAPGPSGHRRAHRDAGVGDAARERVRPRARPWCCRRDRAPSPRACAPARPLWPNALSVVRPWIESRNSAPKAAYAFWRDRLCAAILAMPE